MWAPAHQRGHHHVGLRRLDARNRRLEVVDVEREELDRQILAAAIAGELLHPLRRDVAVVVVGRQDVGALAAKLVHHVVEERLELLRRHHARGDVAAVADTPLIERVVEEQSLEAVDDGAHHLARGAGDAAVHHHALVLDQRLGDVLRVVLTVGLGVVEHQLQRPAQQAAGGVDLVHRHRRRLNLLQAVDVEDAGAVEDVADLDRVLAGDAGAVQHMRQAGEGQRTGCGLEELSTAQSHGLLPAIAWAALAASGSSIFQERRPFNKRFAF